MDLDVGPIAARGVGCDTTDQKCAHPVPHPVFAGALPLLKGAIAPNSTSPRDPKVYAEDLKRNLIDGTTPDSTLIKL